MSKSPSHAKRRKTAQLPSERQRTSDGAIYAGLIMIGAFVVLIAFLLTQGKHWHEVAVGFVIAIAYLTNFYAFSAYRGKHLANWQAALARLPLHFVGYGTKRGKPLEAAHGQSNAFTMILVSIAVSVVIILVATVLLIPAVRP